MPTTRRKTMLAAAGLATLETAAANDGGLLKERVSLQAEVAQLLQTSWQANDALMRGDVDRYREMVPLSEDFTLFSPFGGKPGFGRTYTEATWEGMKTFFQKGRLSMELVQAYSTNDMIVLAVIERARVEVGGLSMQDWTLRVTLVYRRDENAWRLVHRHADPLGAASVSVVQAAELARGTRY